MVNQLLAGVHIAAAAEAIALGARLGLETRSLYESIMNSDGSSWYILHPKLCFFWIAHIALCLGHEGPESLEF